MIRIEGLHRNWKEFALKGIDLEVQDGEYFVILGPTGAGKTLLLELIAGFHAPNRGEIFINEKKVTGLPPEKRNIGFVYQDYSLFPHLDSCEIEAVSGCAVGETVHACLRPALSCHPS